MNSDITKLVGFALAAALIVAAAYVPAQAAQQLVLLAGGVMGWLGMRRPGDQSSSVSQPPKQG